MYQCGLARPPDAAAAAGSFVSYDGGMEGVIVPLPTVGPIASVLIFAELGIGTLWCAVATDVMGGVRRGFVGTTALISAVLMGLALLLAPSFGSLLQSLPYVRTTAAMAAGQTSFIHLLVLMFLATLAFAALTYELTDIARKVAGTAVAALGFACLAAASSSVGDAIGVGRAAAFTIGSGAVLMGAVLGGMLLGHWYLIAPDMTFKPLRRAVYLIYGAVGVTACAIVAAFATAPPAHRAGVLSLDGGWLFWLLVVGSSIVFTLAVTTLALRFTKDRANQPATAMLYGLIVGAAIGVISAHIVMFQSGVPV